MHVPSGLAPAVGPALLFCLPALLCITHQVIVTSEAGVASHTHMQSRQPSSCLTPDEHQYPRNVRWACGSEFALT